MAGRYLVTGAQLGELIALASLGKEREINLKINGIIENQFIGNSENVIDEDVKKMKGMTL